MEETCENCNVEFKKGDNVISHYSPCYIFCSYECYKEYFERHGRMEEFVGDYDEGVAIEVVSYKWTGEVRDFKRQ